MANAFISLLSCSFVLSPQQINLLQFETFLYLYLINNSLLTLALALYSLVCFVFVFTLFAWLLLLLKCTKCIHSSISNMFIFVLLLHFNHRFVIVLDLQASVRF